MERTQSLIDLYQTGFYVCLALLILSLAGAAFLFFKCDIPLVLAVRTGRAAQKTIRRMQEENSRSGSLHPAGAPSGGLNTGGMTGPTGQTSGPLTAPVSLTASGPLASDAGETALLDPGAANPAPARSFRFEITEEELVIHTNEDISSQ